MQEPVEHVHLVGAQAADGAGGELLEPPPVAELLHRLVAVLGQASRVDGLLGRPGELVAFVAVPLGEHVGHAAEGVLGVDVVQCPPVPQVGAVLPADLEEFARLACGQDHLAAVFNGQGHLLLAVHVQPGFQAGEGLLGVEAVG